MKLYDHVSPIKWAYKGTMTVAQIAQDPALAPILTEETVLYDDGEGTVYDFKYLNVLVGMYGNFDEDGTCDIDTSDPQAALDEVWRRMNQPKVTQRDIESMIDDLGEATVEATVTADDIQEQIDAQGAAIEELIALAYTE